MASYTIRVELHSATAQHYVSLATKLSAIGVIDIITADDGRRFKLPPAEYQTNSNMDVAQVRDRVAGVAATVVPSYAVLVSEAPSRAWVGLQLLPV